MALNCRANASRCTTWRAVPRPALIEEGCDVVKADAGYLVASGADLLRNLEDEPLTPANQRLIDLIKSALNVEESTYEAAFEVAQQRLDAHREAFYARMNAYTRHIPWY